MLPPRAALVAFAVRFFAILAVYLIPWAPVGEAYSTIATGVGNAVVSLLPSDRLELTFVRPRETAESTSADAFNAELDVTDRRHGASIRLALDLRSLTYVPTAVFVALAVAAPIWQGRRGLRMLAGGLATLHVFYAVALTAMVAFFLGRTRPFPMLDLGPAARLLFDVLHRVLVAPPGMAFAVPGFVWLAAVWLTSPARVSATSDESVAPA